MKSWHTLLLAALTFMACTDSNRNIDTNLSNPDRPKVKLDHKEVAEILLTLNTDPTSGQGKMDENLFGRFFCDRAEFYIIKHPKNEVFSTPAESITLYYLDSELRQTKYAMVRDISPQLLRDLGSFRILGLNARNRDIISTKKILVKTEQGVRLNSQLDNVELRWTFGDKEITYRLRADSKDPFVYAERVKSYEKEFKAIEKYCI